jgi:TPR repeat protein
MRISPKSSFFFAALAVLAGLSVPAHARFIQPEEVATEAGVKASAAKLKALKDVKEAEPLFKEVKAAADGGSGEALFFLAFLYQSGTGTERSVEKAKDAYQKAAAKGFMAAKNNLGLLQLASGEDSKKSIGLVEEAANAGYSPAQVSMGQLFLDGLPAAGIAQDLDQARVWFERASSAGDDDASLTLGFMYEKGTGVTADQEKATAFFQKAADKGNTDAMVRLGAKLLGGQGIKPDAAKGKGWFEKAIAAGATGAKVALASIYETGTGTEREPGVAKDTRKAFQLYTEAADEGDGSAYNKVAYFYEQGTGVAKDEAKALEWYKKGADKNVPVCIHNLAVFHEEGKGGLKKDAKAAFDLYYKAALRAFTPSQIALAMRYREGKGVAQDTQAALAWFERAMQNGDLDAAVSYAAMVEAGEAGFVNYETSVKIYREAASKGHGPALVALGSVLENGRGNVVKPDFRQAYLLYTLASKGGMKAGTDKLDSLRKRLSGEQIKIAEAFVVSGGKDASTPPSSVPLTPAGNAASPVTSDPKASEPSEKPAATEKPPVPPAKPPTPPKTQGKPPKTTRPGTR